VRPGKLTGLDCNVGKEEASIVQRPFFFEQEKKEKRIEARARKGRGKGGSIAAEKS